MNDQEFESMKDLGKRYGATSHEIGQWLAALGLRIVGGDPTVEAFEKGLVKRVFTQRGNYDHPYFIWHVAKTLKLLQAAGHRQVSRKRA
jgi:hypothetical protein